MPERPFIPPERKPVSEYPTPSHVVAFYTELVQRTDPAYLANAPVKRGSRYSTMVGAKRDVIATYPDLFFLQETKYQMDDQKVLWHWATDENAHDTYNADVTYVANAVTYPAFTRVYTTRRELYEADPTLVIGSPLPGIIAVEITSPGQNHTDARGVIDGTGVAIDFVVDSNGSLVSAIITNTGEELIPNGTPITIIGDGQDSSAIAVTQPVGCVLTAQKKEELPEQDPLQHELVKVTRVYETLPGPWITGTRIDKDGMLVTLKTRRQIADFITDKDEVIPDGTGSIWVQTWHKGDDNFVALENVETRPLPGNPILDTKVEEDGMVTTIIKTLIDVSAGVSNETLVTGVWARRRIEEIASTTFVKDTQASDKVAWQLVESRAIPGNLMETTRIDNDGVVIHTGTTLSDASTIVDGETLSGGIWTKITQDAVSDLVGKKIVETRTIPGNPMPASRVDEDGMAVSIVTTYKDKNSVTTSETLVGGIWTKTKEDHCTSDMGASDLVVDEVVESRSVPGNPMVKDTIEKDGKILAVVRTLKDFTTITPSEQIFAGNWIKTEIDPVSDLVAWEVVTGRNVPGNQILSYQVNAQHEIVFQGTILKERIAITPQATEAGGNITTVEADEVSDLVANEVTKLFTFLDEASYAISIINLIPREFMAFIPTVTESHILSGTASMPTLALGEFEHSQKQLTKLLYENRITSLGDISLPITHTNQELTEIYGGGILNVNLTLDVLGAQAIDQGLLVVSSTLTDLGNGMVVKETKILNDTAWSLLSSRLWDENLREEYDETSQVVVAGTSEDVNPGVFGWVSEVKSVDKWRSKKINISKSTPTYVDSSSALISYDFRPFKFPGLLVQGPYATSGYYVRSTYAQIIRHTIRTWWETSVTAPTVAVDDLITDNVIISTLNDVTELAYSGEVLHDDLTTFGVLFWPATTPSYTEYTTTWRGFDRVISATVTPEREKDVWKLQTRSIIMR